MLYHVTYAKNLPSILDNGLRPGSNPSMGVGGYLGHSQGRLFLTDFNGIYFWMSRAEAFAENASDHVYSDGLTPVALRVDIDDANIDEPGTKDSLSGAFHTDEKIPGDEIDIWNGSEWVPLDYYEEIDFSVAHKFEEDPDSDETLEFFSEYDSPLLPKRP